MKAVVIGVDNQWHDHSSAFLARALGERHEVLFLGPGCPVDPGPGGTWRLLPLLEQRGLAPDFLFAVDACQLPADVLKLPFPTAWWSGDAHISMVAHQFIAAAFDAVFYAQKTFRHSVGAPQSVRHAFLEAGCERLFWLPCACAPEVHRPHPEARLHDVVFVGGTDPGWYRDRNALLERLARRFKLHVDTVRGEEMARTHSRAKVVFNKSLRDDLNQRVFEALACRAFLLTDRLTTGLEDLFEDRKHLCVYDAHNVEELAAYYLVHDEERQRIADEGHREALRCHTYAHRAEYVAQVMSALASGRVPPEPPWAAGQEARQ